ncbi:MAG: hypothetical protein ACRYHQ_27370 [Janthinobacterium lividum]
MRKLLLATVAVLGGLTGGSAVADAQLLSDTAGQATVDTAGQATPDTAGQSASPAPGTITVRLNGRFRAYAAYTTDRGTDVNGKQVGYSFGNYARLFPGFDGVAANGLKYGASLEIRQDSGGAGARTGGGAAGGISGNNSTRSPLYFRREWGYIGTDQLGTVRVGSSDPASSLYMTGNFENFNDGGLNGDIPAFVTPNNQITWPFADVGNVYTTNKIVYLSPQLFGFDTGVSFEPNTGNVDLGSHCDSGIGGSIGCERLSSISSATGNTTGLQTVANINAESGRRRNTLDALLRYRGTFGGFGVAATAGYIVSSHVADTQTGVAFATRANPGTGRLNYDGLNMGDFGIAVTYGGLSVGGKYQLGRYNGQFNLAPKGVPDAEAWLAGASYTIGPFIMGAHYLAYNSAGDVQSAFRGRQRREDGIAAGATYSLAPGLSLFLSYIWTQRKQNGYDFATGATSTVALPGGVSTHNKVTAQVIGVGTGFSW